MSDDNSKSKENRLAELGARLGNAMVAPAAGAVGAASGAKLATQVQEFIAKITPAAEDSFCSALRKAPLIGIFEDIAEQKGHGLCEKPNNAPAKEKSSKTPG